MTIIVIIVIVITRISLPHMFTAMVTMVTVMRE